MERRKAGIGRRGAITLAGRTRRRSKGLQRQRGVARQRRVSPFLRAERKKKRTSPTSFFFFFFLSPRGRRSSSKKSNFGKGRSRLPLETVDSRSGRGGGGDINRVDRPGTGTGRSRRVRQGQHRGRRASRGKWGGGKRGGGGGEKEAVLPPPPRGAQLAKSTQTSIGAPAGRYFCLNQGNRPAP